MDIKLYLDLLAESLTPKQMQYVDELKDNSEKIPELDNVHDEVFARHNNGDKKADRIILPVQMSSNTNEINKDIAKHLTNNGGWTIHDYVDGIATRRLVTKKGFVKPEFKSIGSILQETGGHDIETSVDREKSIRHENGQLERQRVTEKMSLAQAFNTDPVRQGAKKTSSDHQIVISRNKYDIGGMTSGRQWVDDSCMRLPGSFSDTDSGGGYHRKIVDDFSHKTLVAYLTHKGDDLAENPVARVLLKRFTNKKGHSIFRPELKQYGKTNSLFGDTLTKFTNTEYPSAEGERYIKHSDLYDDDGRTVIEHGSQNIPTNSSVKGHLTSSYPVDIKSEKHNEFGLHHTDDNEPSLVLHQKSPYNEDVKLQIWHKNGVIHRDGSPAIIAHHFVDGKLNKKFEYHLHNGYLHSPKDGMTPSIRGYDYDENGNLSNINEKFHKFGKLHNSVMSGVSSLHTSKNELEIAKHHYGTEHTTDNTPSYQKQYINKVMRKWSTHGNVIMSEVKDSDKLNRYGYNHRDNDIVAEHPTIKPLHRNADGKIITHYEIGFNRNYVEHADGDYIIHQTYNGEPTFTPSHANIEERTIRKGIKNSFGNTYYQDNDGPNGEPSFYQKNEDRVEIHHKINGEFHHPTKPAYKITKYNESGKPFHIEETSYIKGNRNIASTDMPVGSILSHTWTPHLGAHISKRDAEINENGRTKTRIKQITYDSKSPATYDEDNTIHLGHNDVKSITYNYYDHRSGDFTTNPNEINRIDNERIIYNDRSTIRKNDFHDNLNADDKFKIGVGLNAIYHYKHNDQHFNAQIKANKNTMHVTHYDGLGNMIAMHTLDHNGNIAKGHEPEFIDYDDNMLHVSDFNDSTPENIKDVHKHIMSGNFMKEVNDRFKPNENMFSFEPHLKDVINREKQD